MAESAAPNRSLDLIRQMFQSMHHYRTYFKDPLHMPPYRIPYFANGADVDTIIVDGRVLMARRGAKYPDRG